MQTLERVLNKQPDHVGAIHLYIHAVEASNDAKRAERYADRLAKLAPGAGHLVHMPAHIYFRIGRYKDSLAINRSAVKVDEAYIQRYKPQGVYPLAYYPHNVHFVLVSAQMSGQGGTAVEAAQKLGGVISDDAARAVLLLQPVKAARIFRTFVRRGATRAELHRCGAATRPPPGPSLRKSSASRRPPTSNPSNPGTSRRRTSP